jgi:hypothetical protein
MSEVVSLNGGPVHLPGTPAPGVVAILEIMLARAKAGEIQAIGFAYIGANGRPSTGQAGLRATNVFAVHSGLVLCVDELTRLINDNPDNMHEKPEVPA